MKFLIILKNLNYSLIMSNSRTFLMKKLIAICPVCKKQIYGRDIDINHIDTKKIRSWPLRYVHCHSDDNTPLHALTMYIDANFSVRGREVSDFIKIQK